MLNSSGRDEQFGAEYSCAESANPFSLHHALTLMPLLWQSRIRCCQSCIDTLALISVIAGVISFMADSLLRCSSCSNEFLEYSGWEIVYHELQPGCTQGIIWGLHMNCIVRHRLPSVYVFPPRSPTSISDFIHVNVFSEWSPSRIRMVRRISLGITTLPRSSLYVK